VLVHCKGGCDQERLIETLRERQLWAEGQETSSPVAAFTRKWAYIEDGQTLGYHCRQDKQSGKSFWWQRPDGNTSRGDIKPEHLPLYRLANLQDDPDSEVLICEGEKAADAATEQNFLAVSFAGGASQTAFGSAPQALEGRNVVLWPDADEAGIALMERIGTLLSPIARRVRWITVPDAQPKDDAADYFARGGDPQHLQARPFTPEPLDLHLPRHLSTRALLRAHYVPLGWVVGQLVPEASLTILGGKKKVGKSWLARQIAGAVGTGDAIFNRPTMHGKVLFYCLEDGERRLQNRLKLQEATEEEDVEYFWELPPLNEDEGMEALGLAMRVMRPVLVIIDTLAAAKNAKIDENAAGPMADLINDLQRLARSEGVAILLVAHHGKSSFGDSGHDIRGSSAISAAADVNLGLYKRGEGYLLTAEGRDIEEGEYRMLFEEYRWQLVGDERSLSAQEAEDDVKRMMVILGETDAGAIARELSRHRSTVDVVLKRLLVDNRVTVRSHHEPGVGRPRMLYSLNSDWSAHDRYDLKK
jgi:hypothetical protein